MIVPASGHQFAAYRGCRWAHLQWKSNLLPWFTASVISIKYIWIVQDTDNYKHIHFHKVHRNHTGYIHIHVNIYTLQTEREALAYVPQRDRLFIWIEILCIEYILWGIATSRIGTWSNSIHYLHAAFGWHNQEAWNAVSHVCGWLSIIHHFRGIWHQSDSLAWHSFRDLPLGL